MFSLTFPYCLGPTIHLCHKLDTKGNKKTLKKNPLNQPFSGLVTLDRMTFNGKHNLLLLPRSHNPPMSQTGYKRKKKTLKKNP